MFSRRLNEVRLGLRIDPASPLLVKSGEEPAPGTPMGWVRAQTSAGSRRYIPGSSLRGVLRTAATHVVGRWQPGWTLAADPFANHAQRWVQTERDNERQLTSADVYREAGPLERCFGTTDLRGRWILEDAWLAPSAPPPVTRDGVGINRHTGAAQHQVKYQFELMTQGAFTTTLTLVNYELWQLGLLAHLLAMLDDGETRLGYGQRRGYGRVRLGVTGISFRWFGHHLAPAQDDGLIALPSLASLAERARLPGDYGWRDQGQRLSLPLVADPSVPIGNAWSLTPARGESDPELGGSAPVDWTAPWWADCARLLPEALTHWPPREETETAGDEAAPS